MILRTDQQVDRSRWYVKNLGGQVEGLWYVYRGINAMIGTAGKRCISPWSCLSYIEGYICKRTLADGQVSPRACVPARSASERSATDKHAKSRIKRKQTVKFRPKKPKTKTRQGITIAEEARKKQTKSEDQRYTRGGGGGGMDPKINGGMRPKRNRRKSSHLRNAMHRSRVSHSNDVTIST